MYHVSSFLRPVPTLITTLYTRKQVHFAQVWPISFCTSGTLSKSVPTVAPRRERTPTAAPRPRRRALADLGWCLLFVGCRWAASAGAPAYLAVERMLELGEAVLQQTPRSGTRRPGTSSTISQLERMMLVTVAEQPVATQEGHTHVE